MIRTILLGNPSFDGLDSNQQFNAEVELFFRNLSLHWRQILSNLFFNKRVHFAIEENNFLLRKLFAFENSINGDLDKNLCHRILINDVSFFWNSSVRTTIDPETPPQTPGLRVLEINQSSANISS
jgi:hypothetical protein